MRRLERLSRARLERVDTPRRSRTRSDGGRPRGRWPGARSAVAARPGGPTRAWRLLGLACLSWGCGQAAWTWYESVLGREVPFPSIADIGYLAFVPLAAAALLAFPSVPTAPVEPDPHRARRSPHRQRTAVHELDGRPRPAVRGRRRPAHADDRPRLPARRRRHHHDPAVRVEPSHASGRRSAGRAGRCSSPGCSPSPSPTAASCT